jgi:carboxyl-terminal processing protease
MMKRSGLSRWTTGLAAGLVLCVSAGMATPAFGAGLAEPTRSARSVTASELVASASSEDDLHRVVSSFTQSGIGDANFRAMAERFEASIAKRESDREAKLSEVNGELEEKLAKAAAANGLVDRSIALAEAMRLTVEAQILSPSRDEFMGQPRVARLIGDTETAAREAEAAGEWMIANELFARLSALLDREDAYSDDVERLGRRLGMIRLYAPEMFRELIAEHRERQGEDAPPPYNAFGDSFEEKLDPITVQAVERAIQHASFKHVDLARQGAMAPMLIAGLDAVEALVTTSELAEVFDSLGNDESRGEFLRFIRKQRDEIVTRDRDSRRGVGLAELDLTLSRMLTVNRFSLNLREQALLHEFGNGAMSALDDYTAVIWPDEIKRFQRNTRGEFVGVGIQIEMDDLQNIRVVTPLEGTPAQRAGVQTGDLIKKVDGHSTVGFTLDQAVEVITGPKNTDVTLTVERGEGDAKREIQFRLDRQRIELPTVRGWRKVQAGDEVGAWDWFADRDAGIGYIRITSFSNNTTDRFDEAVEQMRREGPNGLNGLVLDLRFNPGGLLDEAVSISNRFIDDGMIVKTEDAAGSVRSREFARRLPKSKMLDDIPVVVLINEGSASASEIVSGAIQAEAQNDGTLKATIVGRRSFGKGSVQNVFSLTADNSAMMKLTTQYYKLRGDKIIHRKPGASEWGIEPDIEVEMLPEQIVEAARIRRDADVLALDEKGNIINDPDRPDPDKLLEVGGDLQIQTAMVVLEGQIQGGELAVTKAD